MAAQLNSVFASASQLSGPLVTRLNELTAMGARPAKRHTFPGRYLVDIAPANHAAWSSAPGAGLRRPDTDGLEYGHARAVEYAYIAAAARSGNVEILRRAWRAVEPRVEAPARREGGHLPAYSFKGTRLRVRERVCVCVEVCIQRRLASG